MPETPPYNSGRNGLQSRMMHMGPHSSNGLVVSGLVF